MKTQLAALTVGLLASCASTSYEAQEQGIGLEPSDPVNYTLTERVSGEGSAFALSPMFAISIPGMPAPPSTAARARNQAIGNAVWGNDNADFVLTPKAKIDVMNFFIFETASAEIEGQGAIIKR